MFGKKKEEVKINIAQHLFDALRTSRELEQRSRLEYLSQATGISPDEKRELDYLTFKFNKSAKK